MSRLLLIAVVTTIAAPLLWGFQQQSSRRVDDEHGSSSWALLAAPRGAFDCSLGGHCAALLARMTRGTLGGERTRPRTEGTEG